jgi:hypothetical protein
LVSSAPISDKLFIGGDLNEHVVSTRVGFDGIHGSFGYGSRNQESDGVLNFTLAYDLIVMNTLFRKRVSHLVTFSSDQHCSQIDFILVRREDRPACLDCKVIPKECVIPQHKLVVADLHFRVRFQQSKHVQALRIKLWKLKEEASKTFKERALNKGAWHEGGYANSMWMKVATCIRKVASEEFGVTKESKREAKETWWWNEKVQKAIKKKKECFRRIHLYRCADNVEWYKMVKKTAKRAVSEARGRMYDGLYQRLGTKEGEKDIYRMTKSRERKMRDIIQFKCIKDETERLLTKDEDIKNRWREYFNKLFNEDSGNSSIELDISSDDFNRQFVHRIQESEVKDALKRMKGGKAMGPDVITIEVWRNLGDVAIVWLAKLFNLIF